ncbi:FAD dependent oxidoreductase [Trametopsis cervina]|nr:FAD dependent oxidoreductase [Trametopsis cervina]
MSTFTVPLHAFAQHQTVLELPPSHFTDRPSGLPVPNATEPFWIRHLGTDHIPALTEGSTGELTHDADICIIGSGITGVSTAYHLAQAVAGEGMKDSLKVVVLEAREFCQCILPQVINGAHCSIGVGRNGGHLTPHGFAHFNALSQTFGVSEARRSLELEEYTTSQISRILRETSKAEDVDFVSSGRVVLLFTKEDEEATRADFEAAQAAGIDLSDVRWLTKEEVQTRYGTAYPAVIIPGNNVWPLKLVGHLYNLAQSTSPRLNLTLHTRTPVTSISPRSGDARNWTVNTPRGEIACTAVVHATNGYASHLLPFMHGEIIPTRGQVIAVRAAVPSPFGNGREGFVGNEGFEYWFPRPKTSQDKNANELVILGGGREAAKDGKFEFYVTDDANVNAQVGDVIRGFLPMVFPGKFDGKKEPEMEWTGIMGYTRSGEPFVWPLYVTGESANIGQVYVGQYIAAGYTGHGMPRAFACAEVIAAMVWADWKGEVWTAPKWFPRHYLTTHKMHEMV